MEYLGIPAATLAGWMFGAFWYTSFSKPWLAAIEMGKEEIGRRQRVLNPMLASVLAELVLAAVLFYVLKRMSVVGWNWGAMGHLSPTYRPYIWSHSRQKPPVEPFRHSCC